MIMIIGNSHINEIIQDFLDSVDKAESSKALYKKTLDYFVVWITRNCKNVRDIRIKNILDYRDDLRKKKLSAATIDNYLASVKSLFAWMVKHGYYEKNPTENLRKEKNRNSVYIKQCLTIDQADILVSSTGSDTIIRKRNRSIIKLMIFTGLRCIEINRLNCGDFRQANESWFLQIQRKGQREAGETIPVPDEIVQTINNYLLTRTDEMNSQTPMFIGHGPRNPEQRISTIYLSQMIKAYLRKIGLDGREYSAHSLRHTAASLAQLAGAELYEIQNMLGHTTVNQTERYLKSLGRSIGIEGSAIRKIEQFAKEYRKKHKKQ